MLKAVIFDMDGVLIDSEPLHYEANRLLLLRKFNINLDYEYYKQFIGSTVTYMWEKMREDLIEASYGTQNGVNADGAYGGLDEYTALELRNMADEVKEELVNTEGYMEIDGASAFVKTLVGHYKMAVASSSYLKNIKRNVHKLGITDCFDELVSGTQVANPKPAPDIFLEAAARLGVDPSECIVIEDSENGVKAAKAAGMACVGFINENSGNQNLAKADYLFESFCSIDGEFLNMVHAHCFDERYVVAETQRLVLREMQVEDVEEADIKRTIVESLSMYDDDIKIKNMSKKQLEEYIAEYRRNSYKFLGFGLWLLELKTTGKVMGMAGIDRKESGDFELGYYIDEEYRRLGYAFEACKEILEMKDELGIDDVNVRITKDNRASIGLAKKLGLDFVLYIGEID